MAYTYTEIKSKHAIENPVFQKEFYNFFEIFEDLYNKDEVRFIYLKNVFNSEKIETIIFFNNKFVKVTRDNLHYNFEEFNFKKVNKELFASKDFYREVRLKLSFDDSIELVFDNVNDSNADWCEKYGQDIKELFKML